MGGRSRNNRKEKRAGRLGVSVMVFLLLAVMSSQIVKLHAKEQEYQVRENALQEQLEAEQRREANLQEYEEYIKTDAYVEDVAKSKLGLVYADEIVFKEDKAQAE
ncbi:MAG: septum formation initiator family protein [Lachnospiraceae bacterium]|nr:septum formation initiator family protein [Lachnospiraceae bacterium]